MISEYFNELSIKKVETKFGNVSYRTNSTGGNTLVLIHGLAATSKSWNKFINYLPKSINLIIPDLLGHGESDAPNIEYHVTNQTAIIEEILKKEEVSSYVLFGHSYGGWVATLLSIKNKNLKALILEDSNGLKAFFNEVKGTKKREEYKKNLIKKALFLNANEYVVKSIVNDEFSTHQLSDDDLVNISVPTLILWGELDQTVDRKFGYMFKKLIHNSELEIIKNSKHTPHYSNPEKTADIVKDFLAKIKFL
ncbi:MAG: alpha/beta fold hydrolase [Candidatus Micrarchaeia archaeon]